MKKFNFSLQKVLNLRKFREEECKIALGQAIGTLTSIENEILKLAQIRHKAAVDSFNDISRIQEWEYYQVRLEIQTQKLTEDAAKAQLIVEQKRNEYLESSKELKAMEKLKDKKRDEYKKRAFKEETASLDDISIRLAGTLGTD
jgi:flagellar FliJ protein